VTSLTTYNRFPLAEFRALRADGDLTCDQIAARLNRSARGLSQTAKALGLPPRRKGPKLKYDEALFIRLYRAGVSMAEIGCHFGMHRSSFPHVVRKLGLPPRGKSWIAQVTLAQFFEAEMRVRMEAEAARSMAACRIAGVLASNDGGKRR